MIEDFLEIPGFKDYFCNKRGEIYSKKTNKTLRPSLKKTGYVNICMRRDGEQFTRTIHSLVALTFIGARNGKDVDHINNNRQDNRVENLRYCTRMENCRNSLKTSSKSTSVYKGVYWEKRRQKWLAQIRIDGVLKHIGYFDDEKEAGMAYDTKAALSFKEFAKLNNVL